MADGQELQLSDALARHLPVLRYDSRERFFACSTAAWTDQISDAHPGADPTVIQRQPAYADRVYGHAAAGSDGRMWLSYWFFYLYNDYTLIGPRLGAGRHEGDWEMIQLRLDAAGAVPDLALYAYHSQVRARDWDAVERVGDRPVIYPARGCHACYFSAGWHWTGHWFDRANGRGPAPALELEVIVDGHPGWDWVHWPGRWGATQRGSGLGHRLGLDAASPHGPGHQRQWRDPARLLADVRVDQPSGHRVDEEQLLLDAE